MQIEIKGKAPNLSRFTLAKVIAVGAVALRAHLRRVTDTLAKRHGGGGGGLRKVTGKGIERLQAVTVTEGQREAKGIVPLTKYMSAHEYGATIRAKGGKYLTVPLPAAMNGDGTPKKPSALLWRKAQVIKSKSGNLLIVVKNGRQLIPLYVLKEVVKLPPRLGLRKELQKGTKAMRKDVTAGIRGLLSRAM